MRWRCHYPPSAGPQVENLRHISVMLLATAVALVVGCGRPPRAPAPATPRPASSGAFPVTLTDTMGQAVTLEQRPTRVVSVAPTVTEMLFAIGASGQVAGVTEQCDYPVEVKQVPKVGQWWQPSAERVLAMKPDLVVAQRGNTLESIALLRKSGLKVFVIAPKTIGDIYTSLRQLGALTGNGGGGARGRRDARAIAGASEEAGRGSGGETAHGLHRGSSGSRVDGRSGHVSG